MNWGLASYETRFRWLAALWAVVLTGWCFAGFFSWQVRLLGALLWVVITGVLSLWFAWWRPRSEREVPIFLLMSHLERGEKSPESLSIARIERLVRDLLAAGYRFQTASEAIAAPMRKAVVMTFDGGTRDAITELLPLLRRLEVKATLFVTDRGVHDPHFLTPLEIQELERSGLVELGCTVEAIPAGDTTQAWVDAIARNRTWLAGVLGKLPPLFAYPYGVAPERIEREVRAAGYQAAFTNGMKLHPVKDAPFQIVRRRLSGAYRPWQAYLLATRGRCSAFSGGRY